MLLVLADIVLLVHLGVVLFVIAGLALIVIGNRRGWAWVNTPWFRLVHIAAIAVVVAEAWLGLPCPLTILESWLRVQAGAAAYTTSFVGHWVQRVLFYDAPPWMFTAAYTVFGLIVAMVWRQFPPQRKPRCRSGGDG